MTGGARRLLVPALVWAGACTSKPQLAAGDAGFVQWLGLDSRPLAVGSRLAVTLEIATDAGVAPTYTVISSDPAVVEVEDGGDSRLVLSVVGEGTATLELQTPNQRADLSVTAEFPVAVTIWDAEHFAAGVGGPLDPSVAFGILPNSEELLQAVVLDARGRELNSWGLVQEFDESSSTLQVSKQEPEQFLVAQLATLVDNTFKAGLVDAAPRDGGGVDDGGTLDSDSSVSFTVDFSPPPTSAGLLRGGPSNLNVVAQAFTDDGGIEVFGIDDWEFTCYPPSSCTMDRLSPSAVNLTIEPGSGGHDVTAFSSSQGLMGRATIE
jgi:hypothetical protein